MTTKDAKKDDEPPLKRLRSETRQAREALSECKRKKSVAGDDATVEQREPCVRETPSKSTTPEKWVTPIAYAPLYEHSKKQMPGLATSAPIRSDYSSVKGRMTGIEDALWSGLRTAFRLHNLKWQEPARFVPKPMFQLERLYRVCFGQDWTNTVWRYLGRPALQSLDVLVALIGAAIYLDVFSSDQPWNIMPMVTFRSEVHRETMAEELQRQGKSTYSD